MSGVAVSGTQGVEAELFRRQMYAGMRVAPRADLANAMSVVVLALYVAGPAHRVFGLVWMVLALPTSAIRPVRVVVAAGSVLRAGPAGGRPEPPLPAGRRCVEISLHGLLNSVFLTYLLPRIDPGRQLVLVATIAGILGAGRGRPLDGPVDRRVVGRHPRRRAPRRSSCSPGPDGVRRAARPAGRLRRCPRRGRRLPGQLVRAAVAGRDQRQACQSSSSRSCSTTSRTAPATGSGRPTPTGLLTRASERLAEVSGHSLDQLREPRPGASSCVGSPHPSEQGRQSLSS